MKYKIRIRQRFYKSRLNHIISMGIKREERPSQILEDLLRFRNAFDEEDLALFEPFEGRKLSTVSLHKYL